MFRQKNPSHKKKMVNINWLVCEVADTVISKAVTRIYRKLFRKHVYNTYREVQFHIS